MVNNHKASPEDMVTQDTSYGSEDPSPLPATYIRRALSIFFEHDLNPPDQTRVEALVRAAMAVQHLLLTAALSEPTSFEFEAVFDAFVYHASGFNLLSAG